MDTNWKKHLDDDVKLLKRARDELRVQMHLGAAEAHDTWDKIEKKWEHLESRLKHVGNTSQESVGEIEEAAKVLIGEIKTGYQRIRDAL